MKRANKQPKALTLFRQRVSNIHLLRRKEFIVERTDTVYGGEESRTPGSTYSFVKQLHYCNGILNCNQQLLRDAIIIQRKKRIRVVDRYKQSRNEYSVIITNIK